MIQIEKVEEFVTEILQSQLSPLLTYHNYSHTHNVTQAAMTLAKEEGITDENDLLLLKTAALFHDCGFSEVYENHEAAGCRKAQEVLPRFGYTDDQITTICNMIMKTKLPSTPETQLQKILCDADLDYLGRDDFGSRGDTLFKELTAVGKINSRKEWDELQLQFLQSHQYYTSSAIKNRAAKLAEHINELKSKLAA